jgi:hypothetical protein
VWHCGGDLWASRDVLYFNNINYHRADVAEIQDMLGVSAANPKYKTFPPVLFLGMQKDTSLKTVFRNWELLAKVYFQLMSVFLLMHDDVTLNRF